MVAAYDRECANKQYGGTESSRGFTENNVSDSIGETITQSLKKCILPVTPSFSRGYHRDDDHFDLDVAYLYYERFDDNAPTREPADFSATTPKLLWMCPADLFSVRLP